MAILWCGGEILDFPFNALSPCFYATGSAIRRSAFTRAAIGHLSYVLPPRKSLSFEGGEITSCWLSFRLNMRNNAGTNYLLFGLTHSSKSASAGLYIGYHTSVNRKLCLMTFDGTTSNILASDPGILPSEGLYKIDVKLQDYGASAQVEVYVNGNLLFTFNGNVTISSLTALNQVSICASYYSDVAVVSEIIVADEDTRLMSLLTMAPNAAGSLNEWTGLFSTINEISEDDNTIINVNATAKKAQFNLADTPAGTYMVKAIKVVARATKTPDSSVGKLKLGVRSGGSEDVGAGKSLSDYWDTYERLMSTISGGGITTAMLDALQIHLESET